MKFLFAISLTFFATLSFANEYRCMYSIEEANVVSESQHTRTSVHGAGIIIVNSPEQEILARKDKGPRSDEATLNNVAGLFQISDDGKALNLKVTFIEDYRGKLENESYFVLGRFLLG